MTLFVDDIALYRVINDYVQLQEDINAVSAFPASKHLNISECCYLPLT